MSLGREWSPLERGYTYVQGFLPYLRDRPRLSLALLLFPPLGILAFFFVFPNINMLYISVLEEMPPASLTVENYLRTVTNDVYVRVLGYTVLLTLQATVIALVLGYLLAYSMIRMSRYTTVLLLLIILPFWTNYIVRMYAWMNILQRGGLLDWILTNLNVLSEPSGFLYTHGAVLVGLTYVWLPLATLPFYASLSNMDEQLIDAAKDLGAGPITTFFKVTLPMTKDGLVAGIVLVAIPAFGTFITPDLLGGTDHVTLGMVIDQQFNQTYNWPFGAALGVLLSSFVVLLAILAAKLGTNVLGRSDV